MRMLFRLIPGCVADAPVISYVEPENLQMVFMYRVCVEF